VQGVNVSYGCGSDAPNSLRWDYYRIGKTQPVTIWNGRQMDQRMKLEGFHLDETQCQKNSTCDVHIDAVSRSSAGFMVCFEVGKVARNAASLIVLGE
jgi:hypothetical protein